eukprot:1559104-Amphidinium_carterae.3
MLEVAELISRTKIGNELAYEVRWEGLDDPKQNTVEKISKLKMMGLEKVLCLSSQLEGQLWAPQYMRIPLQWGCASF